MMLTNVEIDFFPKADVITANGRIYPHEVYDKAIQDAVSNHIPVKVLGIENNDLAIAGFVQNYLADKNKMVVTLYDSVLGKLVERHLQQPNSLVVISLAGVGYTDETQKVTDFKPTYGCLCERIR